MNLKTSQILAQLSEQERHKAELKLAELHALKLKLDHQQQISIERIKQLNQQRDQATRTRNAASLLEIFDMSVREQQANISTIHQHLRQLEENKQILLTAWMQAHKTHQAYNSFHEKEKRQINRQHDLKSQRQVDDMTGIRMSPAKV